jgi:hypothetical protein
MRLALMGVRCQVLLIINAILSEKSDNQAMFCAFMKFIPEFLFGFGRLVRVKSL